MNDLKRWPCIVFWLVLCAIYSYWTWTHHLNDFGGDSAVYLLTAQHWSLWGHENPAAGYFASTTTFPPLYPIVLSLFSAGQNWLVAHQITVFCGVAALFVLWRILRVSGVSLLESIIAIAVVALIPGFYSQALYIHSEFLFVLFVLVCWYFILRLETEQKLIFVIGASLAATAAYLTRSVGIAIVAALVVYVLLRRSKKEWAVVFVLAVVPVMIWMGFGQPPGGGYLAVWKERLVLDGSPGFAAVVATQFAAIADGCRENFAGHGSTLAVGVYLFSFACFLAWLVRLWQLKIDALFLGGYFAILLVWPFPAERVRFFLPAVPILVVQLFLALHAARPRLGERFSTLGPRLAVLVLAITVLPSLALTVRRHMEPMPSELAGYRQSPEWYGSGTHEQRLSSVYQYERVQTGFVELGTSVPIKDCIYSIKPALVGLFAQRKSYRSPLPDSALGKQLNPMLTECRYVHMLAFASPTFSEPFYPLGRWGDGLELIHATRVVQADQNSPVVGLLAKIR
jgi:hypothetical protein